jgi:hypothetical protein
VGEYIDMSTGEIIESINAQDVRKVKSTPGKNKRLLLEMDLDNYDYDIKKQSVNSPTLHRMPWKYVMMNWDDWFEHSRRCKPPLSNRDKALVLDIVSCMNFDGIVCNRESGAYMTISEIADMMGWTVRTVLSSIHTLELNRVLVRFTIGRNTHVMMNPRLFYRGYSNEWENVVKKFEKYVAELNKGDPQDSSNDTENRK